MGGTLGLPLASSVGVPRGRTGVTPRCSPVAEAALYAGFPPEPFCYSFLFLSSSGPLDAHPPSPANPPGREEGARGGAAGRRPRLGSPVAAAAVRLARGPRPPARAAATPSGPAPRPGRVSTNRRPRPPPPHLRGGARAPPPQPSQRPRPVPPPSRRPQIIRRRRLAPRRRGAEAAFPEAEFGAPEPGPLLNRSFRAAAATATRGALAPRGPRDPGRVGGRPERAAQPGQAAAAAVAVALGRPVRRAPCRCGAAAAPWPVISGDFSAGERRGWEQAEGGTLPGPAAVLGPRWAEAGRGRGQDRSGVGTGPGWGASAWTAAASRLGRRFLLVPA